MRRLTVALSSLLVGLAVALTPVAPGSAATPVPEADPFYAVPANIASYANGAVIDSRPVVAQLYILPMPATSWQIKYRTNDSHGTPTATVTTLMIPLSAWTGTGPRPLISYQTAEDGVSGKCAPSYGLKAGVLGSASNAAAESGLMYSALSQGWAVSAPDYEGPDSQFLAGRMEGQAVLDGVRASLAFTTAGLPANTPVGLWGYSGGAFATSIASQLQSRYAPELNVQGIALGGVVGEIRKTIDAFSGSLVGGAIAMGVNGPLQAFPEFHLGRYLSASGRQKVTAASKDCITDAVGRYPFLSLKDIEAFPNALDTAAVANLLHDNSPLGIAGTPTAPVYDYHGTPDELAPIGPDRDLMRRYCAAGATVEHVEDPFGEHIAVTITGVPGVLAFFGQRFAGKTPRNTCSSIPG